MMRRAWLDTETYSETPIAAGIHRYAETVEVMVIIYAFDDGPVHVWDRTLEPMPPDDLIEAAEDPETIFYWHQAQFDMTMRDHDPFMPYVPLERTVCTMAMALAHGLPGSLDKLCGIFKINDDKAKMKEGRKLIQLFCKPMPKKSKLRRATRLTHPEEWATFLRYGAQDVEAMRAVYKQMPKFNYPVLEAERMLWQIDQHINARGIAVDLELAHAAIESSDRLKHDMVEEVKDITFGLVGAATQRDALLAHLLRGYGFALPDLRTSTIEVILDDKAIDLPDSVRELLEIRINASRNSTAKYKALLRSVSSDARLRGTLQFCGASRTGRWSAKLMQLHNLSRVPKYLKKQYDFAIQSIKAGSVDLVYDKPMEVLGSVVRGALVAAPGKTLVVSDLSNIEGRVLAWVAGEDWLIKAFEDFDAGVGADLYKLTYARSFNFPLENVDDEQRQLGKILTLAMGYAGGVGAFITFALTYGVDLEAMAHDAFPSLPHWAIREAKSAWQWAIDQKRTYELSEKVYVVCDALKRMWRRAHPGVVQWWADVIDACMAAIRCENTRFTAGRVQVMRNKAWLRIILPSGRSLCYPSPQAKGDKAFTYMGTNQFTKQWARIDTYAGKCAENICQGIARDVLAEGIIKLDAEGWALGLHIHDETLAEVDDTDIWSVDRMSATLATQPAWADVLPLAAAGFTCLAYRKE